MSIKELVFPSNGMYSLATSKKLNQDKQHIKLGDDSILMTVVVKKRKVNDKENGEK